jgi:hypothetical protein
VNQGRVAETNGNFEAKKKKKKTYDLRKTVSGSVR